MNVNISDVTVQIPVAVAADICGVAVNALTSALDQGPTACQAGSIALADDQSGGAPAPDQEGLINVNITDVNVQVPIAVAANVCGVAVNVLVQDLRQGPVDCNAFGDSDATVSE